MLNAALREFQQQRKTNLVFRALYWCHENHESRTFLSRFFHRHFPRSLQKEKSGKENVLCLYLQLKVQTICNLSFGYAFFSLSTHISVDRRSKNQLLERHAGSQNKEKKNFTLNVAHEITKMQRVRGDKGEEEGAGQWQWIAVKFWACMPICWTAEMAKKQQQQQQRGKSAAQLSLAWAEDRGVATAHYTSACERESERGRGAGGRVRCKEKTT